MSLYAVETMTILQQANEDNQMERDIALSAMDYIEQINAGVGLVVIRPRRFTYTIYNEQSAKFRHSDYHKLIMDKVEEFDPGCNERRKQKDLSDLQKLLNGKEGNQTSAAGY